jgi:hypothetical protein
LRLPSVLHRASSGPLVAMASRKLDEVDESGVDRRYKLHASPPPCPSSEHSQAQNNVFCAPKPFLLSVPSPPLLCSRPGPPHAAGSPTLSRLLPRSYYHGTIEREEAVKRLQERNLDGAFLLRQSSSQVTLLPTRWHGCMISTPSVGPPHVDVRALSSRYHSGVMCERARVDACMHGCMHACMHACMGTLLCCECKHTLCCVFFLLVANCVAH